MKTQVIPRCSLNLPCPASSILADITPRPPPGFLLPVPPPSGNSHIYHMNTFLHKTKHMSSECTPYINIRGWYGLGGKTPNLTPPCDCPCQLHGVSVGGSNSLSLSLSLSPPCVSVSLPALSVSLPPSRTLSPITPHEEIAPGRPACAVASVFPGRPTSRHGSGNRTRTQFPTASPPAVAAKGALTTRARLGPRAPPRCLLRQPPRLPAPAGPVEDTAVRGYHENIPEKTPWCISPRNPETES
jgi:hypothetical protein